MIKSLILHFVDENTPKQDLFGRKVEQIDLFPFAKNIVALQHPFQFERGINLVIGRNGSGKTTLLNYIAYYFNCWQCGYTNITTTTTDALFPHLSSELVQTVQIEHDGQIVFYYNPDMYVGLGDSGEPDDEFFNDCLESYDLKHNKSNGESDLLRFTKFLKNVIDLPKKIYTKRERLNPYWQERIDKVLQLLKPTMEPDQITLLLDEPERGLDLDRQFEMGRIIRNIAKKYNLQIILSTHSLILYQQLRDRVSQYIELNEGYKERIDECWRQMVGKK